jgi:hypothetical protein
MDTALYMGRLFNEAAQTVEFIKGRKRKRLLFTVPDKDLERKKVAEYSKFLPEGIVEVFMKLILEPNVSRS